MIEIKKINKISSYEYLEKKADKEMKELAALPLNKFPMEVFPKEIQLIAEELNEKLNFPHSNTYSSILWAASVAIGNSCVLDFLWKEAPNLFIVIVGKPGTNKSHALEFIAEPLMKRDEEFFIQYQKEMEQYTMNKSGNILHPKLKKTILSDSSLEALKLSLYNNPRGSGVYVDELMGWISASTKYAGSQEFFLSTWSRKPIIQDRKNAIPIRINNPFLSIIGTMQFDVVDRLAKGNNLMNGFLDRALLTLLNDNERKPWPLNTCKIDARYSWQKIIDSLLVFQSNEADTSNPYILKFTQDAHERIINWQHNSIVEDKVNFGEIANGISAKNEVYVLKFAIILHLLKGVCGVGISNQVDLESAENAIALSAYFKQTAIETFEQVSNKNPYDKLSADRKLVYDALPNEFYTEEGITTAQRYKLPKRTFQHWLATQDKLFKKISHGKYQKTYI